ncbi:MAG: hypothetical protein LUB56_01275 [Coprobacillus sp.]|nr:hypothetical protein [Coprobacillus sp.]
MKLEELKEGTLYVISDTFFRKVKDPYLMKNHGNGLRPNCFVFCDSEEKIPWVIPLTTKVDKFDYNRSVIDKKIKNANSQNEIDELNKKLMGFKKSSVGGNDCYILFMDMFPVNEKYIIRPYMVNGYPFQFDDTTTNEIINQAKIVHKMLINGYLFIKTQPDIKRIKSIILNEKK